MWYEYVKGAEFRLKYVSHTTSAGTDFSHSGKMAVLTFLVFYERYDPHPALALGTD